MHPKPTVGLTGGIASGKTTVARWLSEWGAGWVDADSLARDVVAPGSEGLAEVVASFGREVLLPDGSLDRKKLGTLVFGDRERRARLEAITHPRIARLSAARILALQETAAPYIVYEAALLVETGIYRNMAAVVVVAASIDVQTRRLQAREGLSPSEARQRIDAQLPVERKLEVADFVIRNEGTLSDLRVQTQRVHEALIHRFNVV